MTQGKRPDQEEYALLVAASCLGTLLLSFAFTIAWGYGR